MSMVPLQLIVNIRWFAYFWRELILGAKNKEKFLSAGSQLSHDTLEVQVCDATKDGSTLVCRLPKNRKMKSTIDAYDEVMLACKEIFLKKTKDYGTAWRVLRTVSLMDQIFIKALRIRNIQENRMQKIDDSVATEFKGIINYALIGLIQLKLGDARIEDAAMDTAATWYDEAISIAKQTMEAKNHDYGEAWREMSQQSFVDLILMKLLRIKQILANDGKTIMSEGIDANYTDIINYAVFALILL